MKSAEKIKVLQGNFIKRLNNEKEIPIGLAYEGDHIISVNSEIYSLDIKPYKKYSYSERLVIENTISSFLISIFETFSEYKYKESWSSQTGDSESWRCDSEIIYDFVLGEDSQELENLLNKVRKNMKNNDRKINLKNVNTKIELNSFSNGQGQFSDYSSYSFVRLASYPFSDWRYQVCSSLTNKFLNLIMFGFDRIFSDKDKEFLKGLNKNEINKVFVDKYLDSFLMYIDNSLAYSCYEI